MVEQHVPKRFGLQGSPFLGHSSLHFFRHSFLSFPFLQFFTHFVVKHFLHLMHFLHFFDPFGQGLSHCTWDGSVPTLPSHHLVHPLGFLIGFFFASIMGVVARNSRETRSTASFMLVLSRCLRRGRGATHWSANKERVSSTASG